LIAVYLCCSRGGVVTGRYVTDRHGDRPSDKHVTTPCRLARLVTSCLSVWSEMQTCIWPI